MKKAVYVCLFLLLSSTTGLLSPFVLVVADDKPVNISGISYIENGWMFFDDGVVHDDIISLHAETSYNTNDKTIDIKKKTGWDMYKNSKGIDDSKIPVKYYRKVFNNDTGDFDLFEQKGLSGFIDLKGKTEVKFKIKDFERNDEYVCKIGFGTVTYSGVSRLITVTGTTTLKDIYNADVAGGWNVFYRLNNTAFSSVAKIQVGNTTTTGFLSIKGVSLVFPTRAWTTSDRMIVNRDASGVTGNTIEIVNSSICYEKPLDYIYLIRGNHGSLFINDSFLFHNKSYGAVSGGYSDSKLHVKNSVFVNLYLHGFFNSSVYVNYTTFDCGGSGLYAVEDAQYENVYIFHKEYGYYRLRNGTVKNLYINDCTYDFYYYTSGSNPDIIDCYSNRGRNDLYIMYGTSTLNDAERFNTFNLKTTPGATVTLYNVSGDVSFTAVADGDGLIDEQTVRVALYKKAYGNGICYLADTPFTLVINKTGYQTYNASFNNSFQKMNYNIQLMLNHTIYENNTIIANLTVHNPNPGNGTHSTNYLRNDSGGLTTAMDVVYNNFTTPAAALPGDYDDTYTAESFSTGNNVQNISGVSYDACRNNTNGQVVTGPLSVGQYEDTGDYFVVRFFLMFDTSDIPDEATITSSHLALVVYEDDYADVDFNVTVQQTKAPTPHNPLISTDYNKAAFPSDVTKATMGNKNITGYTDDTWFNISLNASGLAWLNDSGYTYFVIRSDQDVLYDEPGAGVSEWIQFYGTSGTTPQYSPRLVVNYTVPSSNWQHIVNLTWRSNSSGAWLPYYTSHVTSNGTVGVPAVNFSGNTSYFWNVSYESNGTNSGVTQVWTFTTVNCTAGSGSSAVYGMILGGSSAAGSTYLTTGLLFGFCGIFVFWRRRRKRESAQEEEQEEM